MKIIKSKYTYEDTVKMAEDYLKRFQPILRYRKYKTINTLLAWICYIFILVSDIYVSDLSRIQPWKGEIYGMYIMLTGLVLASLVSSRYRHNRDEKEEKKDKAYLTVVKIFQAVQQSGKYYSLADGFEKYAAEKIANGEEDLIIASKEAGTFPYRITDDGNILMNEMDEELDRLTEAADDLEKQYIKTGFFTENDDIMSFF